MFKAIFETFRSMRNGLELGSIIRQLEPMPRPETTPITVPLLRRALQLVNRESNPKLWAQLQRELGIRLHALNQGDRRKNLEEALVALEAALEVRTREAMPAEWARTRSNLANVYMDRLEGDRRDNVEKAIDGFHEVLEVRTREKSPSDWAGTHMDLATAYIARIEGSKSENQERAIEIYKNVLEVWERKNRPFDWATTQFNLANSYRQRIAGGRSDNIEEAIGRYREALEALTPQGGLYADEIRFLRAEVSSNLALAYLDRIEGVPAENAEVAISLLRPVLGNLDRDETPELWAEMTVKLSLAYTERIHGARGENTELAISGFESALEIWTLNTYPREWVRVQGPLGAAFLSRAVGDRSENVERAIECLERALAVARQLNDSELAGIYVNLGNAYMDRVLGPRPQNIERAIEAYLSARELIEKESEPGDWASLHNNLATAYDERKEGDPLSNWQLGLQACNEALTVYSKQDYPQDWARTQNSRGVLLMNHPEETKEEDLEKSIETFRSVLEIWTRDTRPIRWALTMENLAIAYKKRTYRGRAENLQLAADACRSALEVLTPEARPESHLKLSLTLVSSLLEQEQWQECITILEEASATWEELYKVAATDEARRSLQTRFPGMGDRLAYALARSGNQSNFRRAVVLLERGRARAMTEKLALESVDMRKRSRAQRKAIVDARGKIAALASEARRFEGAEDRREYLEITQSLREAYAALDENLDSSSVPGPGDELTWQEVHQAAAICPLVYLLSSQEGGVALVVDPTGSIRALPLGGLRWNVVFERVIEFYFLIRDPQESEEVLERTLRWLWDEVLGGLYAIYAMPFREREIVLIAGGLLSQLPLQAAWRPDADGAPRYAIDHWTIRYAPNARTVLAAHQRDYPSDPSDRILAIEVPAASAGPLENASFEVGNAVRPFGEDRSKVLRRDDATAAAVLGLMPKFSVLHCCCHGEANPANPLESGLTMAGGELLSLRRLLDLRSLDLRLVVLSACETAVSELANHDEMLGLPVGMLQAGAGGVVGSLWIVEDVSTAILMTVFYDNWRRRGLPPAEALASAQRWMKDTDRDEMLTYLENLARDGGDEEWALEGPPVLEYLRDFEPHERPFADPYYWAGFCYTGV